MHDFLHILHLELVLNVTSENKLMFLMSCFLLQHWRQV